MSHQLLSKSFDRVLLGKNIFSYIYGLKLLKSGEQVLILDDEKLSIGHSFIGRLGTIEMSFLETWGEEEDLAPLLNLESYAKRSPFSVVINNRRVILGEGPASNLRELARKFKEFTPLYRLLKNSVDQEGAESWEQFFNERALQIIKRFGQNLYRFYSPHLLDIDGLLTHVPDSFKKAFKEFCNIYKKAMEGDDDLTTKTLFFALRSHYQQMLTPHASNSELFHLFLMILAPHYDLDLEKLSNDLSAIYKEQGGLEKRTSVREWKFHKKSPWSLELASYEGIIHPKKVTILSCLNDELPLQLAPHHQIFKAYEIRWQLELGMDDGREQKNLIGQLRSLAKNKMLICFDHKLGTSRPFYYLKIEGDQLIFTIPLLSEPGFKMSFARREIRSELISSLQGIIPSLSRDELQWMVSENITEISECWPVIDGRSIREATFKIESGKLPGKGDTLKNIFYYGPNKINKLGVISTLLEIR